MGALKLYFLVFNFPVAIAELCIFFMMSRSTLYKAMKSYGCDTVNISKHGKRRGVKAWELWKFAKATWFDTYYRKCRSSEMTIWADELYESLLLRKNGLKEKRFVRKKWPKLYRLRCHDYIDLTESQLTKAVQCRLIPTVEYFGEIYVDPSFFEQLRVESEANHDE